MRHTLRRNLNTIINDDCLKVLSNIRDGSVDLVFADPPFNLNKSYNSTNDRKSDTVYLKWSEHWLKECVRILSPTGSIFIHNIPKWLVQCAPFLEEVAHFKHWISWKAPTMPMKMALQPAHYGILYYSKTENPKQYPIRSPHQRCRKDNCRSILKDYGGKIKLIHPFGPLLADTWDDIKRIRHAKDRHDHPCQLPIHLVERIILLSTDPNDIVFDPFMGTGTTAVAAKKLGRRFCGTEVDPTYHQIATERLEETAESKIGNAWVSSNRNSMVTIRDEDWNEVSTHYRPPQIGEYLDFQRLKVPKKDDLVTTMDIFGADAE